MNDHWLQLTGKVNIPNALEIDTEYEIVGNMSVYAENVGSKQDGTYNVTHKAKFTNGVALIKGKEVILAKDTERKSQKLRNAVFVRGYDYDEFMTWFLGHKLDEVFEEYAQTH